MKRLPLLTSLAFAGLSLTSPLCAQEVDPKAPITPAERSVTPPANMTDVTLGLAWGGPTHLTGSATLMWGRPRMLVAFSPGKLVQVRVGARGGQIGLGFVAGTFEENAFKPSGLAVTLKAVAIRTWRDPKGVGDGNSYAGLESDIVLLGVRGSLGYARKVSGRGGPDGRFIWSIGLGL